MPSNAFRVAIIDKGRSSDNKLYAVGATVIQGSLDDETKNEVEELTAAGVNGRRLRVRRKLDGPLVLRMTEVLPASTSYRTFETFARSFQGTLVDASILYNGSRNFFSEVYCTRVDIVQRMVGEVVGFGTGGGSGYKAIQFDIELSRS